MKCVSFNWNFSPNNIKFLINFAKKCIELMFIKYWLCDINFSVFKSPLIYIKFYDIGIFG